MPEIDRLLEVYKKVYLKKEPLKEKEGEGKRNEDKKKPLPPK